MKTHAWKFAVIALLTAGFIAAWGGFGLTYGIDLSGGSNLIYRLDFTKLPPAQRNAKTTDSTKEILSKRLDTLALKEMKLVRAGEDKILIQLPRMSEQTKEQIKKVIASAGNLWFKIVVPENSPEYSRSEISRIEGDKAKGEYRAEDEAYDTAHDRERPGYIHLLHNEDSVNGRYLAGADPIRDQLMRPAIHFRMQTEGRALLARTTEKHRGEQMAIVLDGVVQSAPVIQTPIREGSGEITGTFTPEEVEGLVTVLRSGALPAKPILVSEDSVAPTLGADSIRRGMMAVAISLGIILVFMVVFYGWAGLIADIALALNMVILLGVMSLFEGTLTLPGIAGIVLTMGMAVDANILINERMREERERGLPMREVVDAGYSNAFWAIFDSNVTTLLTAVILYLIGTENIRGYAVTLMIGLAASMFTALWVTRVFMTTAVERGFITDARYLRLFTKASFPWIRKRGSLIFVGLVLLNFGFLSFAVRGPDKYGIDFNGGSVLQMRLATPLTAGDVHERLAKYEIAQGAEKVHPYEDVDVHSLGDQDPQTKGYRSFQLLLSSHGEENEGALVGPRAARAEERAAAAGTTMTAEAATPASGATDETAEGEAAPQTPQQRFLEDVERLFGKELIPPAFSATRVEDVGEGKIRFALDVRLDAQALKDEDRRKAAEADQVKRALADAGFETDVTREGDTIHIRSGVVDLTKEKRETVETKLKEAIEKHLGTAMSTPFPFKTSIGSSVAQSLKGRAILAIVLSLLVMIVYIAFRFEFKAGIAASLCLFHDVLVTLGFMMLLDVTSKWTGIDAKLDLSTIAAFLTIVGYSINDTIVTFDRMRENLAHDKPKDRAQYEAVLEKSVNQTLSRTILTSLTVFLVLIVLAIAGVQSLMGFTLAMLIGVIAGTYSTMAIATPILLVSPRKLAAVCAAELALFVVLATAGGFLKL